jgi:O-antigen/teichoic acid export membrane protein
LSTLDAGDATSGRPVSVEIAARPQSNRQVTGAPSLRSVKRRIAANAAYLTAAQIATGACNFLRVALLARYFGPNVYGEWSIALAIVSLFGAVADFGLPTLVVRDLARGTLGGRYLGTTFGLKVGLSSGVFALIALTAFLSTGTENQIVIYLLALHMLLMSGSVLVFAVMRAREKMALEAVLTTGQALALLAVSIIVVSLEGSMQQLASAWLGVTSIVFLITVIVVLKVCDLVKLSFDRQQAAILVNDAWPIGLSLAAISVYYFFDRILMARYGQIEEVGWYTAAYTPVLWISGLIAVVRTAFLPAHSRVLAEEGDPRSFLRFYGKVSSALGVPVAIGGILIAREAILVVYGSDYVSGVFAFQVLCLTAGLMFLSSMYGSQLPLLGRQRLLLADVCVGAAVNVALNLLLVPPYSLDGAAIATFAAEFAVFTLMLYQNRSLLGPREIAIFARLPLAAGAASLLLYFACLLVMPAFVAWLLALGCYALIVWRPQVKPEALSFVKLPG